MVAPNSHIIQYIADLRNINQKVRELERLNTKAASKFGKDFTKATDLISQNIDKISQKDIIVKGKDGLKNVRQEISQISSVVKTADGSFKTFTETQTRVDGAVKSSSLAMKDGAANTRTFGDDIKRLAERALKTVPIWFAIRTAISSLTRTFKDGVSGIISFDEVLQKARRNLQGTPEEIAGNFEILRDEITKLSLETGRSVEEITNAFQKFATVGFNFEESLSGAINSTRLAVLLFGDSAETADAFARALRVLVDRSEDAAPATQQIAEALALTSELWKTNQFDINEVNQGLEKFAAVAKTSNLSIRETLVLLSTLGTAATGGARGATLLRTSLQKLVENLDEVQRELGIKVNPEIDTTFTVLTKVIDKLASSGNSFDAVISRSRVLSEVFGGVRGSLPIQSLIALNDQLKVNAELVPNVAKFNQEVQDLEKTTFSLAKQFTNVNREIGKSLVTAAIGAENFNQALDKIVTGLREIQKLISQNPALTRLFGGVAFSGAVGTPKFYKNLIEASKDARDNILGNLGESLGEEISQALERKLSTSELNSLIFKLSDPKLDITDDNRNTLILQIKDILENKPIPVKPKLDIRGSSTTVSDENKKAISEEIIKNRLDELKTEGALTSELIKQERLLKEQFKIGQTDLDIVKSILAEERARTEERRLQNKLSSDSLKLFEIAQKEGTETARKIGEVLSGDRDFASFVRAGGQELEVFKREFEDLFKSQQALAFFKGERIPGLEGLRGGSRVPIQEEFLRSGQVRSFDPLAQLQQARAESQFRQLVTTVDGNIKVDVNLSGIDSGEIGKTVIKRIAEELSKNESSLAKAVDNRINNF